VDCCCFFKFQCVLHFSSTRVLYLSLYANVTSLRFACVSFVLRSRDLVLHAAFTFSFNAQVFDLLLVNYEAVVLSVYRAPDPDSQLNYVASPEPTDVINWDDRLFIVAPPHQVRACRRASVLLDREEMGICGKHCFFYLIGRRTESDL